MVKRGHLRSQRFDGTLLRSLNYGWFYGTTHPGTLRLSVSPDGAKPFVVRREQPPLQSELVTIASLFDLSCQEVRS